MESRLEQEWRQKSDGYQLTAISQAINRPTRRRERPPYAQADPRRHAVAWRVVWRLGKHVLDPTKQFHESDRGRFTERIDKTLPRKHVRLLYDNLNRKDVTLLSQLRTGKYRLNNYLATITVVSSSNCDAYNVPETIEHYLLHCRRWSAQRISLTRLQIVDR